MFSIYRRAAEYCGRGYARWQLKSAQCNIGKLVIGPEEPFRFRIVHASLLKIGDYTALNGDCIINAAGGVSIGHHCHIARGVTIYSSNHNWKSEAYVPYDDILILKPVAIGDGVWIGANVCILPGAKIGSGAIVSMGAVVAEEVPGCAIVRGNPAEIIGYRDKSIFEKCASVGHWM